MLGCDRAPPRELEEYVPAADRFLRDEPEHEGGDDPAVERAVLVDVDRKPDLEDERAGCAGPGERVGGPRDPRSVSASRSSFGTSSTSTTDSIA